MTTDNNYNPDDFRVPANDSLGHSEREWFRIQPGHDRQLDTIATSKLFPYRSKGDIIRHAVKRHLDWLETLQPVPSVMAQVDAVLEIVREDEYNSDYQEVFDRLGDGVGRYMAGGQVDMARSLVSRVMASIDRMPEGGWRDRYLSELNARFGNLLQMGSGVADLTGGEHIG